MTATKRCDTCWELEHRIEADPGLAERMLVAIRHKSAAMNARLKLITAARDVHGYPLAVAPRDAAGPRKVIRDEAEAQAFVFSAANFDWALVSDLVKEDAR